MNRLINSDENDIDLSSINNIIINTNLEINWINNKKRNNNIYNISYYLEKKFKRYFDLIKWSSKAKINAIKEVTDGISNWHFISTGHYYKICEDICNINNFSVVIYKKTPDDIHNKNYNYYKKFSLNESGFDELFDIMISYEFFKR